MDENNVGVGTTAEMGTQVDTVFGNNAATQLEDELGRLEEQLPESTPEPEIAEEATPPEDAGQEVVTQEETEAEAPSTEDKAETEVEPKWSDQFETPEEMYKALQAKTKSYENLQPAFTKKAQELAELKRKALANPEETTQQPMAPQYGQPQAQPQQRAQDPVAIIKQLVDGLVETKLQPITAQQEQFKDAQIQLGYRDEMLKLRTADGDNYDLIEPLMRAELENNPTYWGLANPIETAYMVGKAKFFDQNAMAIAQKQQDNAAKLVRSKKNAPTGAGNAQAQPTGKSDKPVDIGDEIVNISKQGGMFG